VSREKSSSNAKTLPRRGGCDGGDNNGEREVVHNAYDCRDFFEFVNLLILPDGLHPSIINQQLIAGDKSGPVYQRSGNDNSVSGIAV